MPRREFVLSGYRGVWLVAMFDLPVKSQLDKQRYVKFRTALLREGFSMLQYSVYARYCGDEQIGDRLYARMQKQLPPAGQVRFLAITDRQFEKMRVFFGRKEEAAERAPRQLLLF